MAIARKLKLVLKRAYYWALGPLYRRLHAETRAELERMNRVFIDYHESLTARVGDEIAHLRVVVDERRGPQSKAA